MNRYKMERDVKYLGSGYNVLDAVLQLLPYRIELLTAAAHGRVELYEMYMVGRMIDDLALKVLQTTCTVEYSRLHEPVKRQSERVALMVGRMTCVFTLKVSGKRCEKEN